MSTSGGGLQKNLRSANSQLNQFFFEMASRVASHSHIKGLGLTSEGTVDANASIEKCGVVGQETTREVRNWDHNSLLIARRGLALSHSMLKDFNTL